MRSRLALVSLAFACAVVACQSVPKPEEPKPDQLKPGALDDLSRKYPWLNGPVRKPTATSKPKQCFFDRFAPDDTAEMLELERDSRAMPQAIRGDRKKIYAYFKERIGTYIHPIYTSATAACEDALCFYDKIFKDRTRSVYAYTYFLLTGSAIAVTDAPPGTGLATSADGKFLSDFLFSSEEMRMMLRSADSVMNAGLDLAINPSLRTVHRVPDSKIGFCGTTNSVYMILAGNCLKADWDADHVEIPVSNTLISYSQGYEVYLHELGHVVDFGGRNGHYNGTSQGEAWSKLNDGLIRYDGKRGFKDAQPGFISGYAGKDNFEDFAESFAFYRFRPEVVFTKIPKKFKFLKEKIFSGFDYSSKGLRELFAGRIGNKISTDVETLMLRCVGISDSGKRPFVFQVATLKPWEVACFEAKAREVAAEMVEEFRNEYPEGCKGAADQVVMAALNEIAPSISISIASLDKVKKISAIRAAMFKAMDPKELYLAARGQASTSERRKAWYTDRLKMHFEDYRQQIAEIDPAIVAIEEQAFQRQFAYSEVEDEISKVVVAVANGARASFKEGLDAAFESCVKLARATSAPGLLKKVFQPAYSNEILECNRKERPLRLAAATREALRRDLGKEPNEQLLSFALEVGQVAGEDDTRHRVEALITSLEKEVVSNANRRMDLIANPPSGSTNFIAAILGRPMEDREDICRGLVRRTLYDEVFSKSKLILFATYSQKLIDAEIAFCDANIDRNAGHVKEREEFRNRLARVIWSLAFRVFPTSFPKAEGTSFVDRSGASSLVVDPKFAKDTEACVKKLKEIIPQDVKLAALEKTKLGRFVELGLEETCFNGRYAGRFDWTPSDRYTSFGGIRSLGFAKFMSAIPDKKSAEYHLHNYALRRYLESRTDERVQLGSRD